MIDKTAGLDVTDGNGQAHATVSELYPEVGKIVLFVAFDKADSEAEPNYQQIIFTAHASWYIWRACSLELRELSPNSNCSAR